MRIEYAGTTAADENKFRNRLQQRMARARERFSMVSWRDTAGDNNAIRDRVLSKLSPAQLAARGGLGSTRGSTPGSRDGQGRMIEVPSRRARRAADVGSAAAQVQQPQVQIAHVGTSNASSQQKNHGAFKGFSAVNVQQLQPAVSYGGFGNGQQNGPSDEASTTGQQRQSSPSYMTNFSPQPYLATTSLADPSHQMTLPIMGGWEDSVTAGIMMQQNNPSAPSAEDEYTQQVQDTVSNGGPSADQYNRYPESYAGFSPFEHVQMGIFHAGASDGGLAALQIPYPPSSEGSDGDDEDDGSDMTDDSSISGDCEDSDGKEENEDHLEYDQSGDSEQPDKEIPSAAAADPLIITEDDPRMAGFSIELRRGLMRHFEQERLQIQAYCRGKISGDEIMSGIELNHAELDSCLKRARCQISSDEEVEQMQNRRVKRTRRGADVAGSSGQQRSETQGPTYGGSGNALPGPSGEYHRQGALAKTSRRPATRAAGSAVQRLHKDRLRRPASKATQTKTAELLFYTQPDNVMGGQEYAVQSSYYTQMGEPQAQPSSRSQRQPGRERLSSGLNPNAEDSSGRTPAHDNYNPPEAPASNHLGNQPNNVNSNRNATQTAPRQAYQQPTASYVQDDPFFSDELYNGMLNGHPDANHVGSIYTRAKQQDIDEYYRRVMTMRPRAEPENGAAEDAMPPPPQFRGGDIRTGEQYPRYSTPAANAQGSYNPPGAYLTDETPQPADDADDSLAIGDITGWDPAWSAFVNDHDSGPLLRGHYPDDYPEF